MIKDISAEPKSSGRPRDENLTGEILKAAMDLTAEVGFHRTTVEAIASRAGVSKATIYRWWPNRAAVIMDGFLAAIAPMIPFHEDKAAAAEIRLQMRRLAKVLRSPMGKIFSGLIGEAQSDPELEEAYRQRYLEPRRAHARDALRRGVAQGELRGDLDIEATIDALYAPLFYRLLLGHAPLYDRDVDSIVETVLAGILNRR